jgi:hypothetical protein
MKWGICIIIIIIIIMSIIIVIIIIIVVVVVAAIIISTSMLVLVLTGNIPLNVIPFVFAVEIFTLNILKILCWLL